MNTMIKRCLLGLLSWLALTGVGLAAGPQVQIETDYGNIVVELYPDKAPKTVQNFLYYVKTGFYKNTIFHRVINGFMIQGGGFTPDMAQKETPRKPVENEASNGLSNQKYTIAMARTQDPHSATSQFFINVADNPNLDYTSSSRGGYGYAVFGKVIKGTDVVDKIKTVPTGNSGMHRDVPLKPIIIKDIVPVQ